MEAALVIYEAHSPESITDFAKSGAAPAAIILAVWQTLEHIQAVALPLPDYATGTDPKQDALYVPGAA